MRIVEDNLIGCLSNACECVFDCDYGRLLGCEKINCVVIVGVCLVEYICDCRS